MALWHNNAASKKEDFLQFCLAYLPVSLFFSIILIAISYKSVIELRLKTQFFSSDAIYSENINDLLVSGFKNNLLGRFFSILPIAALVALIFIVSYTVYMTYTGTHHSLKTSTYVNAKKESLSLILMRYSAISTSAFVLPLLFWCFLVAVWYPALIKLPLRYIAGNHLPQLILSAIGMILLLGILTHVGVVLTRLATKVFKHHIKG